MPVPQRPAHPERWFRTRPDSSVLASPRLLARSLIDVSDLDEHIDYYEHLLGTPADLRMPIPDFGGLELAAVGNLLLIASARPFTPIQRQTSYSLIVPSLRAALNGLQGTGTTVLEAPEPILPGARARVRNPDGTLAELVEHRPWHGEEAHTTTCRTDLPTTGVRLLARHAVHQDTFAITVRQYETLLQTPAIAHSGLHGPYPAQTVIVGNLLLVSIPASAPRAAQGPSLALLVPPPAPTASRPPRLAEALTDRTTPGSDHPAPSSPGRQNDTLLIGSVAAEIWSDPAAAGPRQARGQASGRS
jgi:hypothetical protein